MVIYKTTNKINGKIYVGKDVNHSPSYLGSGTLLARAIKKYGKDNFYKITLENCRSIEHLNEREIYWVKELNATDKRIGYNLTLGGTGGNTMFRKTESEKRKSVEKRLATLEKKYKENPKLKEDVCKNMSEKMKKVWSAPEYTEMMRQKMTNREHTWGSKISAARTGWNADGHYKTSDETREKLRIAGSKNVFVEVSPEMEDTMAKMYQECGPKRMAKRIGISAYVIRRVLKKKGVYEKWRKMRPELNKT